MGVIPFTICPPDWSGQKPNNVNVSLAFYKELDNDVYNQYGNLMLGSEEKRGHQETLETSKDSAKWKTGNAG